MTSKNSKAGKVVLVTGPAGNLGSAVVEKFFQEGNSLILLDRHPDRIRERYPHLEKSNQHLLLPGVDLTDQKHVQSAVEFALESFESIDCLVHTTGGFQMGEKVHEISSEKWDLMMDLNVKTLLNITKSVIPIMIKQQDGMIITIGARPSLQGKKNMGSYSAAKAAVLRLTESIAAEGMAEGLTARCIIPGTIDTPQNRQAMPGANTSNWIKPAYMADIIHQICFKQYPNNNDLIVSL